MPSIKQIREAIREEYLMQQETCSAEDDTPLQVLSLPKIGNSFYGTPLPKRPYHRKKNIQTV